MSLRWLLSRTVRQATDLCHRVRKMTNAQRDLLTRQALEAIATATEEIRLAIRSDADQGTILARAAQLETVANKWLKPYPFAGLRENVDVLVVALVVAFAIRTFFLQPMAIPTGSMQPTLFGITHQDLRNQPDAKIPNALARFYFSWIEGVGYYHVQAEADGPFRRFGSPRSVLPLIKKQQLFVGDRAYTVWFPPDKLEERCGLQPGQLFRKGDDIIKLRVSSGDRLFADRLTYNFRRPRRGEIVIFASQGIPLLQQDTHYIKRLAGLGGDKVRIGNDRHLVLNGKRLDASTPGFENIYAFHGPPQESRYSGHVNNFVGRQYGRDGLAPLFPDETAEVGVQPKHFLVLGDNTMNSYDSRYWRDFPQEKVIGKCAFVFWPITGRFGWGFR